jgi:hypothetical protein
MNWGVQLNRSSPDRCALRLAASGGDAPRFLNRIGGGNYTKSSLGQSIIIVDENAQNSEPAEVIDFDVEGPVQHVQAASEKHYPGTRIVRTFALLGRHVLVMDRVSSTDGRPHMVDWCIRYEGGTYSHTSVAEGLSVDLKLKPGSFTDKPGDSSKGINFGRQLKSKEHYLGRTNGPWTERNAHLRMAGGDVTEVLAFAVPAAYSAYYKEKETGVPVLMARRRDVMQTDYAAVLSDQVQRIERLPVKTADGQDAEAAGVRITLADGRSFHALVNYEDAGRTVTCGPLTTSKRFATDYQE